MKYNKLLTLSLISTMTAATLMFTGCGEDKKTTAENTKVEKTDKITQKEDTSNDDTSNETTASEEVSNEISEEETTQYQFSVWIEGEQYYYNTEEELDQLFAEHSSPPTHIVGTEPVPLDHSRGSVEDKLAYDAYVESLNLPEHW